MFALDPAALSGRLSVPPRPRSKPGGRDARPDVSVPVYEQSLWTSRQRQASSLHEVSYRACFKPQLPRYFIERLTSAGDLVYDPFGGRGTTAVEAALTGRRVVANDINPLSAIFTLPRLEAPDLSDIEERLRKLPLGRRHQADIDLSMFYHPNTERELLALREYLARHAAAGTEDAADRWIRMVATNRLTGHSPGFFSVYTLPPNQATTAENQIRINRKLKQKPEYRDTRALIMRKSAQLLSRLTAEERTTLRFAAKSALLLERSAAHTPEIRSGSVQLTVTSPPFLDVVHYARDNWLRCWFNGIDAERIGAGITMSRTVEEWAESMAAVFAELYRITCRGGWVAFEVGEVRRGRVRLEEIVAPLGSAAGFECEAVLINAQKFTKTANIWGVRNNSKGTNTNRIVLLRK
jgi:hypothetical protein